MRAAASRRASNLFARFAWITLASYRACAGLPRTVSWCIAARRTADALSGRVRSASSTSPSAGVLAMSTATPDYLNCSQAIVGGLIDTLSCALLNNFPTLEADPYDIELTLDALRLLRPRMAELDTMEAVLYMQRGHWDDAIRVFSRVIEGAPHFSYAKALLAFCLSVKGDTGWRQWASAALAQNPDRDTRQLVRALEARDDLREAIRVYRNGGTFEVPLSITSLNDELPQEPPVVAAPPPTAAHNEALAQQGYLRI
ncbi:type III secretion protein HrpB1/HrpK [Paraburkholderia phenoliruptrix BR3459a]|uniref:Type III secretion protein HrpB1/HrpK n=2 Tax=Paraburkholderia phenoliruptrix TaxID=252970 RepID=K0E0F7_9BURK|nr:type III secretion protein HrpB1/HrpK [Paraburkholderia phenoliruptrix BR3459a]